MGMDVEQAVSDLYHRRPDQFIEARDALAGALREAGERERARAVARLRRPTLAAWAINRLSRVEADALAELLGLRSELEAAIRKGDRAKALREVGRRRQELAEQLTEAAVHELSRVGTPNAESHRRAIGSTLDAAAADETLGEAVANARLTKEARPGSLGFGGAVESLPAPSGNEPRRSQRSARLEQAAARRREEAEMARQAADQAEKAVRSLEAELDRARRRAERARRHAESAEEKAAEAAHEVRD
jgi:hypothetical protein